MKNMLKKAIVIISLMILMVSSVALAWDAEIAGCNVAFSVRDVGKDYVELRVTAQKHSLFHNADINTVRMKISKNLDDMETKSYWKAYSGNLNVGYITSSTFDGKYIGLTPGTTYYWQIKVEINGVSTESKIGTVTTLGGASKPDPEPAVALNLNKSEKTMNKNESLQLKVTTTAPSKKTTYTWKSSNAAVASVSEKGGLVKAKSAGKATITVTRSDDGAQGTCDVSVIVPASSVKFSKKPSTVHVGDTFPLNATISPSKATLQDLRWTSSNISVATVTDGGQVTCLSKGKTTITVKTHNNKSASLTIDVQVRVKSIALNQKIAYVEPGKKIKLAVKIEPGDATNKKIVWTSAIKKTATVSSEGVVTVSKNAKIGSECAIFATSKDGGGEDHCTIFVGKDKPITSFTIDSPGIAIPGQTYQLLKHVLPEDTNYGSWVKWSVDDSSIATINESSGLLTVHNLSKGGKINVTCSTIDGSDKHATVSITVPQKALFPMKNVTINGDRYSHGRPYCVDMIPNDTAGKPKNKVYASVYAPFDGKISGKSEQEHAIWFTSNEKVFGRNGLLDYITILVMHSENIEDLQVGAEFKQNQVFYTTGNYGDSTGEHLHLECIKGVINERTPWSYRGNINAWDVLFVHNSTAPLEKSSAVKEEMPWMWTN